jgi:hypothetical protein
VLIDMARVIAMKVTVVKIIDMAFVLYRGMSAS